MRTGLLVATFTALGLATAGCTTGATGSSASASGPVAIVSTTQLGSVVNSIASCAGGTSVTLMAPGVDPHEFSLSANDVAQLSRAKLVVVNGLGLEGHLASVLDNVRADGVQVYEVAPDVDPIDLTTLAPDPKTGLKPVPSDEGGKQDPHFWMDAGRMAKAAVNIGARLKTATGDDRYASCGQQIGDKLTALDAELKQKIAALPAERRILITDHEAFNYFAQAYGFTIAGVVVPGGSTEAEPSSADLNEVVAAVKKTGVRAIFSNTAVSPKLVETVSAEAGGSVEVVPLYVDSVGPQGSGAETYEGMMRTDVDLIVNALK